MFAYENSPWKAMLQVRCIYSYIWSSHTMLNGIFNGTPVQWLLLAGGCSSLPTPYAPQRGKGTSWKGPLNDCPLHRSDVNHCTNRHDSQTQFWLQTGWRRQNKAIWQRKAESKFYLLKWYFLLPFGLSDKKLPKSTWPKAIRAYVTSFLFSRNAYRSP